MNTWGAIYLFAFCLCYVTAQLPPRLQIPGAVIAGARPSPLRSQGGPGPRLRRPNVIPSAPREVRPVVEDVEEPNYPAPASAFDNEVNKLGLSVLQTAVRDAAGEEESASPLPFRPERPVPIGRDQVREKPQRPSPPPPPPSRPTIRQEFRDDPPPRPVPVRQASRPAPAPQTFRAAPKPRPQNLEDEEDLNERRRRPVAQILRKYRTDNEDGSITWGFENDDGTFKEETLGADCIIRGKYGYVDPDGVKREFTYETGNKCDEPEEEEQELLPQKPNLPQIKNRPQSQYKPAPQFVN
ncbi:uncharacterized protein LOC143196668 [Rhynchophorus ferrugineus]|uniref:Uncharacterized protein n=1 Tax=Rhynchophorus ferrugineus TaxID=354439 RepID=A0A834M7V4_RHYFE|nr:hypothetical protein GWI33_018607 [Rhynchophorus ferrugineus]